MTITKVSIGILVIKGRLGKMWSPSGGKQEVTQVEKAEVLNGISSLVFMDKCTSHTTHVTKKARQGLAE